MERKVVMEAVAGGVVLRNTLRSLAMDYDWGAEMELLTRSLVYSNIS